MSASPSYSVGPYVLTVSISPGGIPKRPHRFAHALQAGLVGDGHNHAKHLRPDRALSIWDYEILNELVTEGFPLRPGAAGENLTVDGLAVQQMAPGTLLRIGDVLIRLEQPRKPCYVLDAIDPLLKDAVVGRFGYMASVLEGGTIEPGMPIEVLAAAPIDEDNEPPPWKESAPAPGALAYHMLAGPGVG